MKNMLYYFLIIALFGCNLSESTEVMRISDAVLPKDPISTIPVKKLISEVRDETFLVSEKDKKGTVKGKSNTNKIPTKNYKDERSSDKVKKKKTRRKKTPKQVVSYQPDPSLESVKVRSPKYDAIFASNPYYIAEGFDFPVGKPNADGYFLALRFGQKLHLGEDWNGVGGGNTDLGDPVYATADGYVSFAEHLCCGWGNTVRIVHKLDRHPYYNYVESVSSHLNDIVVHKETFVRRGDLIGHIGTADGKYSAHLHLEMRTFLDMNIGPGYSADQFGYISPTPFIRQNR